MRLARLKWKSKNKAKILEAQRSHREENREDFNQYYREYYKKNKATRIPYLNAHRKGRIKDATPSWADKPAIRNFYVNCPAGFHVDHIIPLRGKYVSGLHVLNNLQYLSAKENLQKGNKIALHEERP